MSAVSTVAIFSDDEETIEELNRLADEHFDGLKYHLRDVGEYSGGSKYPDGTFLGGFNYLPKGEYLHLVAQIAWREPFLLVYRHEQDDGEYQVFTLNDLRNAFATDEGGVAAVTEPTIDAVKHSYTVEVPRELLLDAGAVEPTPAERAVMDREHAESQRRAAERTAKLAAAREQLAAITEPLARAVLDLHCENERGECMGDDFDGAEAEPPSWAECSTVRVVAEQYGIDMGALR